MGTLKIEGKSIKEFPYDKIELRIKFRTEEDTASKALEKVMKQGEEFLSILNENGISIEQVKIGSDDTRHESYRDKPFVRVEREFLIKTDFDMNFSNQVRALIQDKEYDVDMSSQYLLSNQHEIHNQLLKEAIADSKKMAEFIASEMDKKITGIQSVTIGESHEVDNIVMGTMQMSRKMSNRNYEYSDQVQAPTIEEEARVNVEWIIE